MDVFLGERLLNLGGERPVGGAERHRPEASHRVVHGLFERRVAELVGYRAYDRHRYLGLGHQRRALGNLLHPFVQREHAGQIARADGIADLGRGLHHVRCDTAGIQHCIMNACVRGHVLAHVIDADIHQLDRVERRAAKMRRSGGVAGTAGELKIHAGVGERQRLVDPRHRRWVPGDSDVGVIESAGAHHERFRRAAFLRGTAIIAHAPRHLVGGKPILHRCCGEQRGRAEQVVAAAMAMATRYHLFAFGKARDLAQAGQSVVFTEDGDDRSAFTGLTHDGGWDVREIFLHPEAEPLQHLGMLGNRPILGIGDLGNLPDPIGERLEFGPVIVDKLPDLIGILHCALVSRLGFSVGGGPRGSAASPRKLR